MCGAQYTFVRLPLRRRTTAASNGPRHRSRWPAVAACAEPSCWTGSVTLVWRQWAAPLWHPGLAAPPRSTQNRSKGTDAPAQERFPIGSARHSHRVRLLAIRRAPRDPRSAVSARTESTGAAVGDERFRGQHQVDSRVPARGSSSDGSAGELPSPEIVERRQRRGYSFLSAKPGEHSGRPRVVRRVPSSFHWRRALGCLGALRLLHWAAHWRPRVRRRGTASAQRVHGVRQGSRARAGPLPWHGTADVSTAAFGRRALGVAGAASASSDPFEEPATCTR